MRLLNRQPQAAAEIFMHACREASELSLAVGAEHLVLAVAVLGTTLTEYGVTPDDIRERIRADERDALASLGISLDSVRGELEERFGEEAWSAQCMSVTPEAKRVLEAAARRRKSVTPEQMLAALIGHSATARRLLFDLDVPVGTLADRLRR